MLQSFSQLNRQVALACMCCGILATCSIASESANNDTENQATAALASEALSEEHSVIAPKLIKPKAPQVRTVQAELVEKPPVEASPSDAPVVLEAPANSVPRQAAPVEPVPQSVLADGPVEEVLPVSSPPCRHVAVSDYKWHPSARRFAACHDGSIDVALAVDNPSDCTDCCYQISICMPACCVGEPRVSSRVGIFRRGIVKFCWQCGWEATVIFRARGDVVVHYDAD